MLSAHLAKKASTNKAKSPATATHRWCVLRQTSALGAARRTVVRHGAYAACPDAHWLKRSSVVTRGLP